MSADVATAQSSDQEALALLTDDCETAREMTNVQLDLMLGDERPLIDWSKPEFSYNASRLWRDRPDVARAAIKLLAEPRDMVPYRRIMKRLHMSYHLLRQLEVSSAPAIATEKKALGDLMYSVTETYAERAIELAPSTKSGKDAMIAAGIGAEKFLMFRGEATAKIDVTHKIDFGEQVRKLAEEAAKKFAEMKRATVIEVQPEALPAE